MKIDIYSLKFKIFMLVIFSYLFCVFIAFSRLLQRIQCRENLINQQIQSRAVFRLRKCLAKRQNKIIFETILGNLGWFFSIGFFARYKFALIKTAKIVLFGFLFSLLIEISQFVFKTVIFELDDLILNSIGVFFFFFFYEILLKFISFKFDSLNQSLYRSNIRIISEIVNSISDILRY